MSVTDIQPQSAHAKAEGPAWERYVPAVEAMCPGCTADEKRQRAGIMLLRDLATQGMPRACPDALTLLLAVQSAAIVHATTLPPSRLETGRLALVRTMAAARAMQEAFCDE